MSVRSKNRAAQEEMEITSTMPSHGTGNKTEKLLVSGWLKNTKQQGLQIQNCSLPTPSGTASEHLLLCLSEADKANFNFFGKSKGKNPNLLCKHAGKRHVSVSTSNTSSPKICHTLASSKRIVFFIIGLVIKFRAAAAAAEEEWQSQAVQHEQQPKPKENQFK